jgi:hypothetical protein
VQAISRLLENKKKQIKFSPKFYVFCVYGKSDKRDKQESSQSHSAAKYYNLLRVGDGQSKGSFNSIIISIEMEHQVEEGKMEDRQAHHEQMVALDHHDPSSCPEEHQEGQEETEEQNSKLLFFG